MTMIVPSQKKRWVGGGIFGLLALAEVVLLVLANGDLARQKRSLERSRRRLSQLESRPTFPSAGNVQALRNDSERLAAEVAALEAGLILDPFPRAAVEAADFSARAQDVIDRFKKRADQAGVVLPDSQEAGFAKYASGGVVPDAAFVPRLCRQLYSMERVADVLVRSGIDTIDELTRDAFEAGAAPAPDASRRRRPRRDGPVPGGSRPMPPSEPPPHSLYSVERIGVAFTGKEAAVWRVLDRIASAPHCMAVSEFSHATESAILAYDPEAVKRGADNEDETLRYLSEGILSGKSALTRYERIIAGDETIRVRLVVEVYHFRPAEVPEVDP